MKVIKVFIAAAIVLIVQPIGFMCQFIAIGFGSGQQKAIDLGQELIDEKARKNENK